MTKDTHTPKMTAVFECSLRAFNGNPFKAVTPFGSPATLCVGDMLNDPLRDAAPDMLEVLQVYVAEEWSHMKDAELAHELELGNEMVRNVIAARAAIAKARGLS